jgi:hypothetical protein
MKPIHRIIAAAAFACAEPAQAGVNDPEVIIYRGSGVADTGGAAFTGNATAFHCTNFSGVNENIRFVVRNTNGVLLANQAVTVAHLNTVTVFTKQAGLFPTGTNLNTGAVLQGTVAIAATSIQVTCTAMLVQANITTPEGMRLHMTRFNPIPATLE